MVAWLLRLFIVPFAILFLEGEGWCVCQWKYDIYLWVEGSLNILQDAYPVLRGSGFGEKAYRWNQFFFLLEDFGAKKCDVIEQFNSVFLFLLGTVCNLIIIMITEFHKMQDVQSIDCWSGRVNTKTIETVFTQLTLNVLFSGIKSTFFTMGKVVF